MNIQAALIVRDDKETSSLQVGYFLLSKESSRRWCHSSACEMNASPEESPCTENNTSQKFKSKLIFTGSSELKT